MPEWKWLESTKKLQEESYGVDFSTLEGDDLADYFIVNHTALVCELTEFMDEVGWKPWATPRGWVSREQAVKELIDAGHFLANLCAALGVTDEEWVERYQAKQALNAKRQLEGYDGKSTKCPSCKRAVDDTILKIAPNGDQYCVCGYVLKRAVPEEIPQPGVRTQNLLEHDDSVVVPCHHVAPRPPDFGGVVTCEAGHQWKMTPEHGGRSWKAERVGPSR